MKMKTTLTLLFAATALMASAQKGPFDSMWESNDSIPFVWDGGIYLPATIDNKYPAHILFTTNANRQLVVDTTYLKEQCWQPAIPDSVKRNYRCLPLTVTNSKFMIEAYVWFNNKRIGGLYELCLEGGDDIMFTKETVRKHNLMAYEGKTQQLLAQYTNIGDTTTTTTTFALADSVYLGLQNIGSVVVNISLPTLHAFPQMRNVGYIGASILHNYNLVFDPAHNKLYYRPYKAYTPEKRTWGFSWVNRTDIGKGWIVRSIYKGSAAEKAGIKLGDTIIKVNGKKVENYSWDEERALSHRSPITLVLKTGKGVRKVTIETMTVF